jgi:hypothetical protein
MKYPSALWKISALLLLASGFVLGILYFTGGFA